jgi:hypothetical protein
MLERLIRWIGQRRCEHHYRKHWSRDPGRHSRYVERCTVAPYAGAWIEIINNRFFLTPKLSCSSHGSVD